MAGEDHSTSQGAVAGGTLVNLWLPQACASPQRGGLLAFLDGAWHEVAGPYQFWAQGPGCRIKWQLKENPAGLQTKSHKHVCQVITAVYKRVSAG